MSTFPQDIDSAIKQYQHLVWAGERRALRVAEDEPRRAAGAKLYVQVVRWLGALWANRARALLHSGAVQGEQVAG